MNPLEKLQKEGEGGLASGEDHGRSEGGSVWELLRLVEEGVGAEGEFKRDDRSKKAILEYISLFYL